MDYYQRQASFPNRTLFKRKKGTYVEVKGQTFYLSKVLKESYRYEFECYFVFFEGQPVQNCRNGYSVIQIRVYPGQVLSSLLRRPKLMVFSR